MIDSNVKEFKALTKRHKDQVPFATSKAINETTKGARPFLVKRIKRRQKSNKAWWNSKMFGISRTFAKKKKLRGSIFTRIPWGRVQEEGGTKTPHKGGRLSIPTTSTPKSRRKSGGARIMLNQKKTFFAKMRSSKSGIWRRKGKKRLPIELLYSLAIRAKIDQPFLYFKKTVEVYVKRNFRKNHLKAMADAIKTARRR